MSSNRTNSYPQESLNEEQSKLGHSELVQVVELSEKIAQRAIDQSMDEINSESDEIIFGPAYYTSEAKSNGKVVNGKESKSTDSLRGALDFNDSSSSIALTNGVNESHKEEAKNSLGKDTANQTVDESSMIPKIEVTKEFDFEADESHKDSTDGGIVNEHVDDAPKDPKISEAQETEADDGDVSSSFSSLSSSEDESDEKLSTNLKETSNNPDNILIENAIHAQRDKELPAQNKEQGIELADLKKELELAKTEQEAKDRALTTLQGEKTELEKKVLDAEKRNEELTSTMGSLQDIHKKLKEDMNSKTKELQETLDALKEREKDISSLRKELADSLESKNTLVTSLQNTRTELDDTKETLESQEKSIADLKDRVEGIQSKNEEQQEEICKLKDDLESANAELGRTGQETSLTESQLADELEKTKAQIRNRNQDVSKLEARLSNSQTLGDKADVENQALKEEIKSLKDKIKYLERKRSSEKSAASSPRSETQSPTRSESQIQADKIDKRLSLESQRRSQERIQELQQKVIQVNSEKQKIKVDYDEAVKALEAVDKVYSVREMALQKYKAELEEANELLKRDSSEIEHLKQEISQLKDELRRAEENKAEREVLKEQIVRAKEAANMYKEELETVRKDLSDQVHELNMAQARARERGKKIQIMDLEIREIKDAILISKNVLDEKEKNMESIRVSLAQEKKKVKELEREVDELSFVKKKLGLTEEENKLVEGKLKQKEREVKETLERLKNITNTKKEQETAFNALDKEHKKLKKRREDRESEIVMLKEIIESKESDVEEQLMELIDLRGQNDDLNNQLTEMWASYNADKAYWRNKAERSFTSRRRAKSAWPKRSTKTAPPETPTQPGRHSMAHRRLVNKLGVPLINPNYIQTQHKEVPKMSPQPSPESGNHTDQIPPPDQPNLTENSLVPINGTEQKPPRLSPRPPDTGRSPTRITRPLSSYGTKTYPPAGGDVDVGRGYYSDTEDVWMERGSLASGDSEEQFAKHVVHQGDRVMIQSQILGDGIINVSGVVKYVGKVGQKSAGSSVYVGLKLDQPFGDNSGTVAGKRYFKCQPKHGKLVKVSDIQAIMHSRTHNYESVKPITPD